MARKFSDTLLLVSIESAPGGNQITRPHGTIPFLWCWRWKRFSNARGTKVRSRSGFQSDITLKMRKLFLEIVGTGFWAKISITTPNIPLPRKRTQDGVRGLFMALGNGYDGGSVFKFSTGANFFLNLFFILMAEIIEFTFCGG